MKHALISPNEHAKDPITKVVLGARIAWVTDTVFDIAPPLFWVDCNDEVEPDKWYYKLETQQIESMPPDPFAPRRIPITTT